MPQEQDYEPVAVLEEKTYISTPAITGSCLGFLNLSCFFPSKLHAFPTNHQQITSTQGFRQQCEKENDIERSRWMRVMGCRFWGLKNRVREEITFRVKQLDLEKTTDGYAVMHLQEETLKPHLALKKKKTTDEEQEQFRCDQEPRGEAPQKGINDNKWGLYEDLPRIEGWERDVLSSHYELVRPVLEPVPVFLTSDMEQGKEYGREAPELQNSRHSSKGGHLKKLWLDSDDDFAQHGRVIKECKSVVTQLSHTKGKEQATATLSNISSFVAMLDSSSSTFWTDSALLALRDLATENNLNKAAIEKADAVPKLVSQLLNPDSETSALHACFTTFSSLDLINALIAVSGFIPPLTNILKISRNVQIQSNALEVLYNLSHTECNTKTLVNTGATSNILNLVKNPLHCEKALAILANVITIPLGRRAMMNTEDGVEILVSVLACGANLKWQERAVGLLMVMAHYSYSYRQAMVRKRAFPALLELSLLGSAVAQKQAMRILGLLRDDREQAGRAMWASVGSYIPYRANQQRFMIHTESS